MLLDDLLPTPEPAGRGLDWPTWLHRLSHRLERQHGADDPDVQNLRLLSHELQGLPERLRPKIREVLDLFDEGWFADVIFEARLEDREAGIFAVTTDKGLAAVLADAVADTLKTELQGKKRLRENSPVLTDV